MQGWRRHRGRLSGWLIAVLLFAQLATAAYACPMLTASGGTPMADMPGCTGHMPAQPDPDQPQLCKAHCDGGSPSFNSQPAAADLPPPALIDGAWVRVLDLAAFADRAAAMPPAQVLGPPAGSPPLYLALLVLRN